MARAGVLECAVERRFGLSGTRAGKAFRRQTKNCAGNNNPCVVHAFRRGDVRFMSTVTKEDSSRRMKTRTQYVRWFDDISIDDIPVVGGKNASLGEMYRELSAKGVKVPNGFAVTGDAYRCFLAEAGLLSRIDQLISAADAAWRFTNCTTEKTLVARTRMISVTWQKTSDLKPRILVALAVLLLSRRVG
jgi:hypothetical protein